MAGEARDLLAQLAVVLATGSRAVWPDSERNRRLAGEMLAAVRDAIDTVAAQWWASAIDFDAVLHHGSPEERRGLLTRIAQREGPIVNVHGFAPGEEPACVERLLIERVVSVNTTAAGGNATLMSVG